MNDLSGTDVVDVMADLSASGGGADGRPTMSSPTPRTATTSPCLGHRAGLRVADRLRWSSVSGAIAGSDQLTVNTLAGDDVVDASGLAADSALLT